MSNVGGNRLYNYVKSERCVGIWKLKNTQKCNYPVNILSISSQNCRSERNCKLHQEAYRVYCLVASRLRLIQFCVYVRVHGNVSRDVLIVIVPTCSCMVPA